ncbi:TauD/TfdA family dioxygenase [Streptosporangium algeriense]|uniref:TauD/TfdA family dioxygenase n=1 Tax=Streptosporangium algeriense TaxID=1682748 RepID=A0ABW3DP52_9ACTN
MILTVESLRMRDTRLPVHETVVQRDLVRDLLTASEAAEFFGWIRRELDTRGFVVADVPGFAGLTEDAKDTFAVAVCSVLGVPSPVGATGDLVVWEVRPRPDLPDDQRRNNISVSDGEACLHTDSTFAERPERWFTLWCVCPARDGGASVLVDSSQVIREMDEPTLEVLRTTDAPLWDGRRVRRIRVIDADARGEPVVRYRADLLAQGVEAAGLRQGDALLEALRAFEARLASPRFRHVVPLRADQVLFVDNHRILHAREHFTDARRRLLRIRIHQEVA